MKNKLNKQFATFNEVMENIQHLWSYMTDEEKEECVRAFFGIRNKNQMLWFVEKYTPVKH